MFISQYCLPQYFMIFLVRRSSGKITILQHSGAALGWKSRWGAFLRWGIQRFSKVNNGDPVLGSTEDSQESKTISVAASGIEGRTQCSHGGGCTSFIPAAGSLARVQNRGGVPSFLLTITYRKRERHQREWIAKGEGYISYVISLKTKQPWCNHEERRIGCSELDPDCKIQQKY